MKVDYSKLLSFENGNDHAFEINLTGFSEDIWRPEKIANRQHGYYIWVNQILGELEKNETQLVHWTDGRWRSDQSLLNFTITIAGKEPAKPAKLLAALIFYHALWKFCVKGDRYKNDDYHFLLLFAAWQSINFSKLAILFYNNLQVNINNDAQNWKDRAINLFEKEIYPENFKICSELIANKEFSAALVKLSQWLGDKKTHLPLVREKLLTSLFLVDKNIDSDMEYLNDLSEKSVYQPKYFVKRNLSKPVQWADVELLGVVVKKEGSKAMARNFVVEWLLSRYDFQTAFHFARLLKKNRPAKKVEQFICNPKNFLAVLFLVLFWASIPTIFGLAYGNPFRMPSAVYLLVSLVVAVVAIAGIFYLRNKFDSALFLHLILPRLWGGIFVGYFSLVLEGDTPRIIAENLFKQWYFPVIYGFILISLVYIYMNGEILSRIRDQEIARFRAKIIVMYSLGYSVFSSFLFLPFVLLSLENNCLPNPWLVLGPSGTFVLLSVKNNCLPNPWLILGPAGTFDLRHCIIFVPLALVTGVILQFIFEKQPVTAPIWEIELD